MRKLTTEQLAVVEAIIDILISNGHDFEELMGILGLSEEDIYERFKDKIYQIRDRFAFALLDGGAGGDDAEAENGVGEGEDPD